MVRLFYISRLCRWAGVYFQMNLESDKMVNLKLYFKLRPLPWMTFCNAGNEANAIVLLCYTLFVICRWNYTILNLLLFVYFIMINTNLVITNYKTHLIFTNRNRRPKSSLNIKEIPNNIVNIPNTED